jgi:hypothetical protein
MLIDAATRGAADDLQLILQKNPELINQKDKVGATRFITPPLPEIATPPGSSLNSAQTSTPPIPNSVPRLPVGQLNICAKWTASSKSS